MILVVKYLAHSSTENHPEGQSLKEHLENVSELAELFAQQFGTGDGRICGLLHDIGKYSDAFQQRLAGNTERVDHSSAGALVMFEKRNIPVSMCIAGHHTGLADMGTKNDLSETFMARINHAKEGLEDCSAWRSEITDDIPVGSIRRKDDDYFFYIKMLYSALTDADWLDTEAYFSNKPVSIKKTDLILLKEKLDHYVSSWWNPKNEVNRRRCKILRAAIDCGEDAPGLFSLTVPTGGGKTVSSMAFALNHALHHGKQRIIYVIPYCSILEQTQSVFEKIFGREFITAHYSGAELENPEGSEQTTFFSAENWDAPIILTTAVQFFESLYSNKPGKNRKLHNIANSIIIFDEAQMLPVPFLKPCVYGICKLVENYECSAVLCTATQPVLDPLLREFLPEASVREMCPDPEQMYKDFRRVQYTDDGALSDEELIKQLRSKKQVLCVVNSRQQAQKLYQSLSDQEGAFHLSTMMTPYDRKSELELIRRRLKNGQKCIVISTSLIEAGVDVDFPEVYRALAGLDSIIQAGGRCNREGMHPMEESVVHIFRADAKPPRMLEQNVSAASRTLQKCEQADSPEAIHDYFQFLFYRLKDESQLDERDIIPSIKELKFKTIAEQFSIIDGADYSVYIPVGEGKKLIEELQREGPSRHLLRQLGQYTVNVYHNYFEELRLNGAIETISDHVGVLINRDLYSQKIGLPFTISEQN